MAQTWIINMLVDLQSQKRPVTITEKDNLNTLEHNIYSIFELSPVNDRQQYQVQFYDAEFEEHIDLCSITWDKFQALCHTLSIQSSPRKRSQEWHIKIVNKVVGTAQVNNTKNSCITTTSQGAPVSDDDDKFSTSQEEVDWGSDFTLNDLPKLTPLTDDIDLLFEQIMAKMGSNNIPNVSSLSEIDDDEDIASQSGNDDEHDAMEEEARNSRPNSINNDTTAVNEVPRDYNYNLRFDLDLAGSQRYQSQSEAIDRSSGKLSIGGCLLEAAGQNSADVDDKIHPLVKFNIPEKAHGRSWSIRQDVLTQSDANGNDYLHPSKEILDEERLRQSINTNELQNISLENVNPIFINPLEVKLSKNDLQRGAYEIRSRVFNLNALPIRKKNPLKPFSLRDQITGDSTLVVDGNQPPSFSLSALKLSHKNYHLAVSLLLDGKIVACCISSMTTQRDRPSKKRKHDEAVEEIFDQ